MTGGIGFNDNNNFINEAPKTNIIVRSKVNFSGTDYNFIINLYTLRTVLKRCKRQQIMYWYCNDILV